MNSLEPRRVSRRSRPSLAALKDSGYEPRPSSRTTRRASVAVFPTDSVPEIGERNSSKPAPVPSRRSSTPAVGSNFDLSVAGQLFADGESKVNGTRRGSKGSLHSSNNSQLLISGLASQKSSAYGTASDPNESASQLSSSTSEYVSTSSRHHSGNTSTSAFSGLSHRLFSEPSRSSAFNVNLTQTQRDSVIFVKEYDVLAKKLGLQPFPVGFQALPASASVSSLTNNTTDSGGSSTTKGIFGSNTKIDRFLSKVLRRSGSSRDLSNQGLRPRRVSMGDLTALARGKRDTLKGMHLEDIIRLGGVCEFVLPRKLAPAPLLIPTSIHAAASFILAHGM